ncbi:MAG: AsmA family protein [Hyphomicrobiaceae bacterium]
MSRVLILIGAVIACALTALIVVPRFVDWNHYRGVFEAEASRLLGREVSVRGEVNLRLLPTPYMQFDEIRIADRQGDGRAPIFKADGFTVWLAPGPLFRGALEASRVELNRPVLTLVTERSGGGNWASLGESRARPAFAPSSITLHAVHIADGAVVVQTPEGDDRTRFEIATGEFSAAALEGPYKLQAVLKPTDRWGAREIRLSTAKPEADGSIRFKGTLRTADGSETYALDGQLSDLTGRSRVVGELTATLPLPTASKDARSSGASASPSAGNHHGFDLRATLNADMAGLALADVALSFDNDGHPQLITGEARLAWQDASSLIRLESRWLDLDRIAGRDANTAPLRLLAQLAVGLDKLMPATGRTDATFALDQATLGGDVVSGLRLEIAKEGGALKLKGLRASLPAGTRLDVAGALTREEQDIAFDGDVTVRGASLNRFLAWARRGQDLPEFRQDGSFTMRGKVSLGANRFAGRDMILQLAGNTLSANASWSGQGKRQLAVSIDGPELDIGPLLGSDLRLPAIADMLLQRGPADAIAPARNASAPPASQLESMVQIRVGHLVAGPISLRDVVADVAIDQDGLKVPVLKFASDDGFSAEFSGAVAGLGGNSPKGSIGGQISAARGPGVSRLAEILGVPAALRPSVRRADALGPLRLAGTLTVGARGSPALDLAIDGMLGDSRLTGRALLESLRSSWREQRVDVTASLDGQELSTLLAQVLPETLAGTAETSARTPARAMLKAVGVPARNLVSLVTLDAAGLSGDYRGRLVIDETGIVAGEGETRVTADDLGRATALLGLTSRTGLEGISAQARFNTILDRGSLKIETTQVTLGSAEVGGQLEIALRGERPRISGRVRTNEISMPRLVAIAAPGPAGGQVSQGSTADGMSPWPDTAFDLRGLADFDADIRIESPIVRLAPDITVADATLETQVAAGRASIKLVNARGLAGKVAGRMTIGRIPAGVSLEGEARLMNAALEAFVSGDRPAATGEFSLELNFSSLALSPRGLIAAMRGKGTMTLGDAHLYRMGPGAVNSAALGALAVPSEGLATELRRRLREGLAIGAQTLGPRRLGLELTDGAVRFEPLALETSEGRVTANTTVDLEALKFDSEWRIDPKPLVSRPIPGKGALPGISLVYVGPLSRLGAVEPRLQSDALERDLGVRKMEGYVDELERVRRQDEESLRREAERLRSLELERQRLELERQNLLRRSAIESPAPLSAAAGGLVPNLGTGTAAPVEASQPDAGQSGSNTENRKSPPPIRQQPPTPGQVFRYFGDTRP